VDVTFLASQVLDRGYVFVSSDYEGLGTPGDHTYVVGLSAGKSVLDIARASQGLLELGVTPESPVLVWGHSQGGGAAAFAAELAPSYAPELDVRGAAIGAPAAELRLLGEGLTGRFSGLRLMTAVGFSAAYPELELADILSPEGVELAERIRDACNDRIFSGEFSAVPAERIERSDAASWDAWNARFDENTPGNRFTTVPMFVFHGEADELIPVEVSARMTERYCARGATVQRTTYPGASHVTVLVDAQRDIDGWLTARLAGEPAPSSC
jgi:pimeloyl-ACP methyl ester carboxylesterase